MATVNVLFTAFLAVAPLDAGRAHCDALAHMNPRTPAMMLTPITSDRSEMHVRRAEVPASFLRSDKPNYCLHPWVIDNLFHDSYETPRRTTRAISARQIFGAFPRVCPR